MQITTETGTKTLTITNTPSGEQRIPSPTLQTTKTPKKHVKYAQ